jgi:hypothetical protein
MKRLRLRGRLDYIRFGRNRAREVLEESLTSGFCRCAGPFRDNLMRNHRKLVGAWLLLSVSMGVVAGAEEITNRTGEVFKAVTVLRVEPDGIAVTYRPEGGGMGMAKLKFRNLPENFQRQYGYDEKKAAAFEAKEARGQIVLQARIQADYKAATNRLAQRLAREESQWQADQEVAKAKLNAQQLPRGGGGGGGNAAYNATLHHGGKDAGADGTPIAFVPTAETASNPPQTPQTPQTPQRSQPGSQGEIKPQTAVQRVDASRPASSQGQSPASGQPNQQAAPAPLPQDVINQIEQQAAERSVVTGGNATASMFEALKKAGASSQQLQQAAAQRGVVLQNVPSSAAPVRRK